MPTFNQLVRKGRQVSAKKSTAPALQKGWNSLRKSETDLSAPQKRGVCTVVSKLFNIVQPDKAYFGQKDAQQLAVIRHMVSDLNFGIEIVGCPIVREADGLAKSSRNTYLNEQERKAAVVLNQSLQAAQDLYENGERSAAVLSAAIREKLAAEPLAKPDYVEIVDWNTLEPVETIQDSVLMAIAVYIGKTRLIDNRIL